MFELGAVDQGNDVDLGEPPNHRDFKPENVLVGEAVDRDFKPNNAITVSTVPGASPPSRGTRSSSPSSPNSSTAERRRRAAGVGPRRRGKRADAGARAGDSRGSRPAQATRT
ncbi:hypothetical protein [Nannocystis pusilla]|uniref:hypothetical protein n=1 Tax=Nannocystis pusilla TaxID=889268 RepID=UPI003B7B16A7